MPPASGQFLRARGDPTKIGNILRSQGVFVAIEANNDELFRNTIKKFVHNGNDVPRVMAFLRDNFIKNKWSVGA